MMHSPSSSLSSASPLRSPVGAVMDSIGRSKRGSPQEAVDAGESFAATFAKHKALLASGAAGWDKLRHARLHPRRDEPYHGGLSQSLKLLKPLRGGVRKPPDPELARSMQSLEACGPLISHLAPSRDAEPDRVRPRSPPLHRISFPWCPSLNFCVKRGSPAVR